MLDVRRGLPGQNSEIRNQKSEIRTRRNRFQRNQKSDITVPPSDEGGGKTERSDVLTEGEISQMSARVVAGFHACHTQSGKDARPGCDENKFLQQ